ncbi:MAG TPA: hypothetical protein VHX68_01715 [Planctomycetaceae bacterium]|nr:hypothetical protein [Planctomycetaceae bacterium]
MTARLEPYWIADRWYWQVEFEGNRANVTNGTGVAPQFRVVILMDGKVLEPIVKPLKDSP